MYEFIDINEIPGNALPSEALKINGAYIEDMVPGYRTLHVQGRESLHVDIETFKAGARDGAVKKYTRYPERVIVVTYQLIAKTSEEFRAAYNTLAGILNCENAELIFNDEPDKFFRGTPAVNPPDPGRNAVIGTIEFLCLDPFKYSVMEHIAEATAGDSSVLIDYKGTYKAYPILEADMYAETEVSADGAPAELTGNGDCGFVAFFSEDKKAVQIGDPDEIQGLNDNPASQTLMNQLFTGEYAWGDTAKALWTINDGAFVSENIVEAGNVQSAVADYTVPASTSAVILKKRTSTGSPLLDYTVTAQTTERTETTVKVTAAIQAALTDSVSGIGTNREIKASLYIGGSWRSVILKKKADHWKQGQSYTANITATVSGLSAETAVLSGIRFKAERTDDLGRAGILAETACSDLPVSVFAETEAEMYFLCPSSYGEGAGMWHGPSITRTFAADASGITGAKNFTLTYKQKMSIGNDASAAKQMGAFQAVLSDATGAIVAGVRMHKNNTGNEASMLFYVNGQKVYGTMVDLSFENGKFSDNSSHVPTSSIVKSGDTITFSIGGIKKTFTDETIENVEVTKATFMFEQLSTSPVLEYNGLYWAKFVKHNCDTFRNIPNKFSANDIIEADCRTGEIYMNGALSPDLGALGNEWEGFVLTPGLNQIGFAYSSWIEDEYAPVIKVRYREVFL